MYCMCTQSCGHRSSISEGIPLNKRAILPAVGLVVATCLTATPIVASAAPLTASAAMTQINNAPTITSLDWTDVAARAMAAGDHEGAAASLEVRDALTEAEGAKAAPRNIWTALAKKAVIEVLKHASSKLPAKIRPYAMKIVGVIEQINSFQQTALVSALTHAGIPYDVSVATAQWIMFFLGL